jgi:hypothetical protein
VNITDKARTGIQVKLNVGAAAASANKDRVGVIGSMIAHQPSGFGGGGVGGSAAYPQKMQSVGGGGGVGGSAANPQKMQSVGGTGRAAAHESMPPPTTGGGAIGYYLGRSASGDRGGASGLASVPEGDIGIITVASGIAASIIPNVQSLMAVNDNSSVSIPKDGGGGLSAVAAAALNQAAPSSSAASANGHPSALLLQQQRKRSEVWRRDNSMTPVRRSNTGEGGGSGAGSNANSVRPAQATSQQGALPTIQYKRSSVARSVGNGLRSLVPSLPGSGPSSVHTPSGGAGQGGTGDNSVNTAAIRAQQGAVASAMMARFSRQNKCGYPELTRLTMDEILLTIDDMSAVFDEALTIVINLINSDVFPRFSKTDAYKTIRVVNGQRVSTPLMAARKPSGKGKNNNAAAAVAPQVVAGEGLARTV